MTARHAANGFLAWIVANAMALKTLGTVLLGAALLLLAWGGKADERRFTQTEDEIKGLREAVKSSVATQEKTNSELRDAVRAGVASNERTNQYLQELAREVSRLVGRMDAKP